MISSMSQKEKNSNAGDISSAQLPNGVDESKDAGVIRCDACPVLCRIRTEKSGACDRYANVDGVLTRVDPLVLVEKSLQQGEELVSFVDAKEDWDGNPLRNSGTFVTAVGAGTTYPDFKPAPFIVSAKHQGVDMITVVSEGIFSYCGVKVKIDTDRHIGPEQAPIFCKGEEVGHVTTGEYGSQMLSLGGVNHLTGGSKKEGKITCETLLKLCNREAVELNVEGGSTIVVEAGKAPIINGVTEQRMRVGCGSATIGMFAQQWCDNVDEVVVVDDHITGLLSEHQAGRCLDIKPSGIRVNGRRSTPGRYFQVANPGAGWGGTDIVDPLSIIKSIDKDVAKPGMRILLTTTTGEESTYCVLNDDYQLVEEEMPAVVAKVVDRIGENCEPSLCTVLFIGGAGGSLRAGVTENPVRITQSVKDAFARVTMGGAPVYVWPGGGITVMVDVTSMPTNSFGYVPTPALVAPIEFSMTRTMYEEVGGHMDHIVALEDVVKDQKERTRNVIKKSENPWPLKKLDI